MEARCLVKSAAGNAGDRQGKVDALDPLAPHHLDVTCNPIIYCHTRPHILSHTSTGRSVADFSWSLGFSLGSRGV